MSDWLRDLATKSASLDDYSRERWEATWWLDNHRTDLARVAADLADALRIQGTYEQYPTQRSAKERALAAFDALAPKDTA